MTYYIVKSPVSGHWMRAPAYGFSPDRADAFPYRADSAHLREVVRAARDRGRRLRLRQVMVVEEDA